MCENKWEKNKQHSEVLLSSFYLNGQTLGFHTETLKLLYLIEHNKQRYRKE